MYTVLSKVEAHDKSAIKINKDALLEYELLKRNDLFSTIKVNAMSGNAVTILVHNLISLPSYVDDIVSYNKIINNGIIGFMETQIKPSDSTCKIINIAFFLILILVTMKIKFKFSLQMGK